MVLWFLLVVKIFKEYASLYIHMPSGSPLRGRIEKPSEQAFDGFSYYFKPLLIQPLHLIHKSLGIKQSDLRKIYTANPCIYVIDITELEIFRSPKNSYGYLLICRYSSNITIFFELSKILSQRI